ncbi:uncharacterized protein N7459_004293 [Penicillium hispanicum]|uniref:uncharacterized protein n=1 Tax=Penicillium hispanicum TaxID=1080232 RepID=UPI0025409726|nr:uncharacterized protein N7459_004293 [Penicillium hispanicum]KAJ5584493.1 hypothetical protein N7459_004293 [Penicillium hispanicum]
MSAQADRGLSHRGVLHEYAPRLVAFEFTSPSTPSNKPNSLIFVGGLTDGLCTVPYVSELAAALEPTDWSLFSILLSSSYNGFGVGSLDQDVEEIGQCMQFIRDLKAGRLPGAPSKSGKIALMGHSTGSQDVLHYLHSPNPLPKNPDFEVGLKYIHRPELDGAIMQAPVSDREAVQYLMQSAKQPNEVRGIYDQLVSSAKLQPWTDDKVDSILPMNMTSKLGLPGDAPLSARRFLSLISPDSPQTPAPDDLFSSDLSDQRHRETFGVIGSRGILQSKLLVLYSGSDEYCPPWVNKEKLMERWKQATEAGGASWDGENSGVVLGASHNVKGEGQKDLIERVLRYLHSVQ